MSNIYCQVLKLRKRRTTKTQRGKTLFFFISSCLCGFQSLGIIVALRINWEVREMPTTTVDMRKEERSDTAIFVKLRTLDEMEEYQIDSLIIDLNNRGATLLSHIPLPTGTNVSIELGGLILSKAEVVDWQWDYRLDKVRLGVKFINAPNNYFVVKKVVV